MRLAGENHRMVFLIASDHLLRFALVTFTLQFTLPFGIVANGYTNTTGGNSAELARILGHNLTGKNSKPYFYSNVERMNQINREVRQSIGHSRITHTIIKNFTYYFTYVFNITFLY